LRNPRVWTNIQPRLRPGFFCPQIDIQKGIDLFTIKHVLDGGDTVVQSCDSYSKTALVGGVLPKVRLVTKGEVAEIHLRDGDTVYIENSAGRTTDVIRTPKSGRK
jgi:hypothetical protein